uniref:Uncharacterized protein n=1 Tax=Eutreptiella gymnastica TaxID=73025 RepID=A0A7S4FY48_9EUGL
MRRQWGAQYRHHYSSLRRLRCSKISLFLTGLNSRLGRGMRLPCSRIPRQQHLSGRGFLFCSRLVVGPASLGFSSASLVSAVPSASVWQLPHSKHRPEAFILLRLFLFRIPT